MTGLEFMKKAFNFSFLLIASIAAVALFAVYNMTMLNWSYSKGERIGYIQKFSEKGWLCKTWEGELQMQPIAGALPEKFIFSVRDTSVVTKINSSLGKKVSLYYEQHKGLPTTCLGESEYFAVDARILQ
jgi:hypothetical protein